MYRDPQQGKFLSPNQSIKSCKIAHLCLVTQQVNHLDCQCNTVDVLLWMVSLYLRDI